LQEQGYTRVREYGGGMADWLDHGGKVESAIRRVRVRGVVKNGAGGGNEVLRDRTAAARTTSFGDRFADVAVHNRSIGGLLGIWLTIVLGFGLMYWAADLAGAPWISLDEGGPGSLTDLLNALYFSFVTALTIGYGDISPLGPARILAVIEGAAGLLVFGLVISKLVSRRQEELMEDIHRIAFEQRLGRVRTSLHLVLSELQAVAKMCSEHSAPTNRVRIRAESTLAIFEGELRTVHDLLYNPEQMPEEQALESILASITASLEVLLELLGCMPLEARESQLMKNELRQIHLRAVEICSDCVPQDYAEDLSAWMDRVKEQAEKLG